MFDHVSIGVSDIKASGTFYDAVLKPIGYTRLSDGESALGYGEKNSGLWLLATKKPVPANKESGLHFCFEAHPLLHLLMHLRRLFPNAAPQRIDPRQSQQNASGQYSRNCRRPLDRPQLGRSVNLHITRTAQFDLESPRVARVVKANIRWGNGRSVSRKTCQPACRFTCAYSW